MRQTIVRVKGHDSNCVKRRKSTVPKVAEISLQSIIGNLLPVPHRRTHPLLVSNGLRNVQALSGPCGALVSVISRITGYRGFGLLPSVRRFSVKDIRREALLLSQPLGFKQGADAVEFRLELVQ
jgi:hypothetical protein